MRPRSRQVRRAERRERAEAARAEQPDVDWARRRQVSAEIIEAITAVFRGWNPGSFEPGWFDRYRPPWLEDDLDGEHDQDEDVDDPADQAKALSMARLARDEVARQAFNSRWRPLDPAEVERRAADASAAERCPDAFDPACPSCAAMQRACAFCIWRVGHPDITEARWVECAGPTTDAGRKSRAWSEAAAARNRPEGARSGGRDRVQCPTCGGRGSVWDVGDLVPCPACNAPAPAYPGMLPGGLAERAYWGVRRPGSGLRGVERAAFIAERERQDAEARAWWSSVVQADAARAAKRRAGEAGAGAPEDEPS